MKLIGGRMDPACHPPLLLPSTISSYLLLSRPFLTYSISPSKLHYFSFTSKLSTLATLLFLLFLSSFIQSNLSSHLPSPQQDTQHSVTSPSLICLFLPQLFLLPSLHFTQPNLPHSFPRTSSTLLLSPLPSHTSALHSTHSV